MTLEYTYTDPQGNDHTDTSHSLSMQASAAGFNPKTISPDGLHMTLQDENGPYQVGVKDFLEKHGNKVSGIKPQESSLNEEGINPWWRFAISNISDDGIKKAYLADKLREHGVKDPQIIGEGRDFHLWNPTSGKWVALTNSRHWGDGMGADAAEFGNEATHALSTGIGAIAAGAGSGGLATAAGAAGGSAVGNLLTHGVASLDPAYRKNINVGQEALHGGITAGVDAALMGGGKVLGKLAGSHLGKISKGLSEESLGNLAKTGLVGSGVEKAGQIAEPIMGAGKFVTRALDTDIGKDVLAAGLIPATSGATGVATLAQLPGYAAKGLPRLGSWLSERQGLRKVFGGEAMDTLGKASKDVLWGAGKNPLAGLTEEEAAKEIAKLNAKDVLGNVGEKIAGVRGKLAGEGGKALTEEELAAQTGKARAPWEGVGQALEKAEKGGEALQGAVRAPIGAALKVGQGLFWGGQKAAQGAKHLGRGLKQVENPAYLKAASDANLRPHVGDWLGEENQSRMRRRRPDPAPFDYGPGSP